jgi:hypothetical protein
VARPHVELARRTRRRAAARRAGPADTDEGRRASSLAVALAARGAARVSVRSGRLGWGRRKDCEIWRSRPPHGHGGAHLVVVGRVEWLVGFMRLRTVVNHGYVTSNRDDILTGRHTFSTL